MVAEGRAVGMGGMAVKPWSRRDPVSVSLNRAVVDDSLQKERGGEVEKKQSKAVCAGPLSRGSTKLSFGWGPEYLLYIERVALHLLKHSPTTATMQRRGNEKR